MVAARVNVLFTPTEPVAGIVTPVTGMLAAVTVEEAVFPPSFVVAVTTAEPGETPRKSPFASTLTTDVFDEDQVTLWLVALAGNTVAASLVVSPTPTKAVEGLTATEVSGVIPTSIALMAG